MEGVEIVNSKLRCKCASCIFRAAENMDYLCDFALLTGHTRQAVPPELCEHFEPGEPLESKRNARTKGPGIAINPSRRKTRYDWEKAKKLYDQKWSDPKIADAMGCRVQAVLMWRKREKLASWPQSEQIKVRKGEVR